jgi:mandelate racemase
MAMAGIDMAAWDALGRASGLPLVRLLGGEPRPVPAYNSCGLGLIGPERAAQEARELVAPGFSAVKVRLGYPEAETDLAVIRVVREAVGPQIALMTDYNQCLTVPEAVRRIRMLEPCELAWVEEPVLAEDYAGHAAVRRQVKTPIQSGENWWGPGELSKALAAGASDFVMADAMKIGGVSGWLRAASLAEAAGTPLSSHLFPEFSVHLLAVTPARHWLEYIEFAAPILREPLRVEQGMTTPPERPGAGLEWDEEAVSRLTRR